MTSFAIKGWCPSALRPMPSGDGFVVRLRPRGGRLSPVQAEGIAELSQAHGNGLIDLTGRANLQIRGVREQRHEPLIEGLDRLGLVDAELQSERQRNIVVAPFWTPGDDTQSLAAELEQALAIRSQNLPEKFGFAVDCGAERVLSRAPADIRIERGIDGGLMVRADGALLGRAVARDEAVEAALSLADWFVASGGVRDGRGRMAAHLASDARLPDSLAGRTSPAPAVATLQPGPCPGGALVGFAFGQLHSATLRYLASLAPGLRMTPWRMMLVEGLHEMPEHEGFVTRADDPLLRVVACTGAPICAEAHAETRKLAAALAPHVAVDTRLHVSGCAKGCAHPAAAAITLVGTRDGFDLVRDGSPRDGPALRGLSREKILADPGALLGSALMPYAFETDGPTIYRQSFATIRAEADLARFSPDEEPVVVRMIHAAGLVGLEAHVRFTPGMASSARAALQSGAAILCDARMVSEGITRARLPAGNRVICTLDDPAVPKLAQSMQTTRSAAALELWRPCLDGAIVAIGNAPTALFHLLNMLEDDDCSRPAAIIGCPVGFVGAAESKAALMAAPPAPALTVLGRLGGSAITVAAVNALASRSE